MKEENKYFGRDEYFNSVIVESDKDLTGKILNIKIMRVNQNTLFGQIVPTKSNRLCRINKCQK